MNNNSAQADHSPSSLCPWHWGWSAALALIVLVTLAFRYALPVRDGDLWFHMLYGKYFLEHQTLIADHTIFSWTPTTNDTIYVTWLPDIFLYLLHKAAGLPGIFAFRYLCMLVPVAGCYFYARKLKIVTHPLTWLLCLLAVIMSYTAAFEKPEILSFVFMTLLAWNWWHIRSSGEEAWQNCYLFPVIMLAWVNTHGGFVFGAIFLVLIGLGELCNTWLSPQNTLPAKVRKHLTIALFLAALTPLLNPYGYSYPLQLFFDLLPTKDNISYNNKIAAYTAPFLFAKDTYSFTIGANMVIFLLLCLSWRNFRKIEWSALLVNLVFAYLYTCFFRTTFFWVPVFLFSCLYLLAMNPIIDCVWKHSRIAKRLLPVVVTVAALWLAGDALYKSATQPEKYLWMGFGLSESTPVAEAQYIKKYFPQSRIGNTYDQGAYLLWELWPGNTVFFDARHFPYRTWSDAFLNFSAGKQVREMTEKYPCDLWCVGLNNLALLMKLLDSGHWKLAFYGKNAAILVRIDTPLPANAPMVSPDLAQPKNLASAADVLTFACSINDWQTAKKLFDAMNITFTLPPQRQTMRWVTLLYRFRLAYHLGNYHEALINFEQMREPPTIIRFTGTNCYHFLASEAWDKGDATAALSYARKAWNQVEGNVYSIYNLGVIAWQQEQNTRKDDRPEKRTKQTGEKPPDWRRFLREFLQQAPTDQDFIVARVTASAMLDGKQHNRPALLTPPKPSAVAATSVQ